MVPEENNMIYHTIGFTGTRRGMTHSQIVRVTCLINMHSPEAVRHGDCIGADEQFHNLCVAHSERLKIIIHPPTSSKMRAYCKGAHAITKPKPYLDRNKDIVIGSHLLIACPAQKREVIRSGTWFTVRYARKIGAELVIIYP